MGACVWVQGMGCPGYCSTPFLWLFQTEMGLGLT